MKNESLQEYYRKWERICNELEDTDVTPAPQKPNPGKVPLKIDPKDISMAFGDPMTEEEFRASQPNMVRASDISA